ncbi:hypothetical protein AMJ51_01575 [Microgenomates bacterium DG_75]|nr:MAG: hypothetical protein AMJ51_01575 [Microgenomates bacterium DG_75]
MVHPYRTLRVIRIEEDFSQAFLLIAFPFYLWLSSVFVFLVFKFIVLRFFSIPVFWSLLFQSIVILTTGFLTLWCGYVGYWLFYYLKVKRRVKKELG